MYENYSHNSQPQSFYPPQQPPFQAAPQPPKQAKRGNAILKTVALCLVCALLGGLAGIGGALAVNHWQDSSQPTQLQQTTSGNSQILLGSRENATLEITQVDTGKALTPAEVYAQNVNATVGITTSITTNYWGYRTTSAASGSGFIFSDDGYILTNYHVVESANSITVTTYEGKSYEAQLIGYDESNDLAVLKIEATGLAPVIIGSSGKLNVGESVVAIGNPLGELTFSLTTGVVSALNREVTLSSSVTMNLIQTDCAINSGNSGGPLFNLYGEVVGITNAKYSSSGSGASIDNIGFAIPMDDIYPIIVSIIENGYIATPYIGVQLADVSVETQAYGLPQGAAIRQVEEGSPAQAAGLKSNDIITQADDTPITSSSDLVDYVGKRAVGDTLLLKVYRSGKTVEISLTVGQKIQPALGQQSQTVPSQGGYPGYGPWGGWGN